MLEDKNCILFEDEKRNQILDGIGGTSQGNVELFLGMQVNS